MKESLRLAVVRGDVAAVRAEIAKLWFFEKGVLNENYGNHSLGAKIGAIFGESSYSDRTLLSEAVFAEYTPVVVVLLEAGATIKAAFPDITTFSGNPLFWVIRKNNLALAEVLLSSGINVNQRTVGAIGGTTVLHYAATLGLVDFVRLFLAHGAVSVRDNEGRTPAACALARGHRALVERCFPGELTVAAPPPPTPPRPFI